MRLRELQEIRYEEAFLNAIKTALSDPDGKPIKFGKGK